jgi:hypothetical protein
MGIISHVQTEYKRKIENLFLRNRRVTRPFSSQPGKAHLPNKKTPEKRALTGFSKG